MPRSATPADVQSIVLTDAHGKIVGANAAAYRMMRCAPGALVGKDLLSFYSPRNDPGLLRFVSGMDTPHPALELQAWKRPAQGDDILCTVSVNRLTDTNGLMIGMVELSAEAHCARQSMEHFVYMAQLLDSAVNCIISTDAKGVIKSINKAGEKMFGYRAEELIGKHVSLIQARLPEAARARVKEKADRGESWEAECLGIRKDGSTFSLWFGTSYLRDDAGRIKSAIGISRDITPQKEVEERLRYMAQLLENAAHCILSTDPKGTIKSINKAGEKMFGYRAEELIGKHVSLIQARLPEAARLKVKEKADRGEDWEAECLGIRKDGSTFPLWFATSYLFDDDGRIKSAIGISKDITRIKETEERLRYMAQLLEYAANCIISTDAKGVIKSINKAGEKMFGYRAEELIGKHVSLIQARLPEAARLKVKEKADRGEDWEAECLGIRKDGSTFPLWFATSYLFDDDGRIKSAIGISRDITRIKETEERLQYMALLIENASHGIISTDTDNIILSVNRAAEALYGYRADELIGKPVSILYSDRNPKEYLRRLRMKMNRRENWDAELWRKKKNGEEILIWISTSYLFDEKGRIRNKISIERDITKVKQMEEELLHSAKLASLGEMAAGIAHEIKNPLTGIALGLEKLERSIPAESNGMQTVEKISREIKRINEIVSRLLDLSRKKKPELEMLHVNAVIRDVLLNITPLARQKRAAVHTELAPGLSPLEADMGQLYQVFLNLSLNAIQAMPKGGTLTIATRELESNGNRTLAISFADTGVGISRENLRRIFEPFYSTRKGGTGLGMSISHRIVQDHGGRISVESEPGHGTTITVLLPVTTGATVHNRSVPE